MKIARKIKRSLILSLIGLIGFLTIHHLDKEFSIGLFSHNIVNVTAEKPLIIDKVKIINGNYTINRENDLILFDDSDGQIIFDQRIRSKIPNQYGENDFLVTYDNKYYYQFRQFKTNNWHQHDYNFHFKQMQNQIKLKIEIHGPDGMKFEKTMNQIVNAKNLKTNVPKDRAGGIYNMKELEIREK